LEAAASNATHLSVLLTFNTDVAAPAAAADVRAAFSRIAHLRGGGWGAVSAFTFPTPSTLSVTAERLAPAPDGDDGDIKLTCKVRD
jgi:hypothetical protein